MIIGRNHKYLANRKIAKAWINIFGVLDLHSHLRLNPLIKYLKLKMQSTKEYKILDLGCGDGTIAFELENLDKRFSYIGVDSNEQGIFFANKIRSILNPKNEIKFIVQDLDSLNIKFTQYDIIILSDILEHIIAPKVLLDFVNTIILKGGIYIVSVPTPLYPKVFGQKYHNFVGHKRDGYSLDQLKELFHPSSKLVYYKYNTGLISCLGCFLSYRIRTEKRALMFLLSSVFYIFRFLDFINSQKISSSLFAVFRRQ